MGKLTLAQQDKATNARLIRTYNITLDEYNQMLEAQGGGCKICKKPPQARRLHVDHDHKIPHLKPTTTKEAPGVWVATYGALSSVGSTKSQALKGVKKKLLRASVRGILCWPCNGGIRTWNDNPTNLRKAAQYLDDFQTTLKQTLEEA